MKDLVRSGWIAVWMAWGAVAGPVAAAGEGGDQTLSPYFLIQGGEEGVRESFPLASTEVEVDIAGVIADVEIKQVYRNTGDHAIEAVYVFPGSTRAAVYGMEMQVGERRVVAEIEERQQARQQYEEAVSEGKTASLLEQKRPNVFEMNVGNVLPGDHIEVTLRYTELLIPEDGIYSFIFPTVVGPRYSNQPASAPDAEPWVANPYLQEGVKTPSRFQLHVDLSAGMPIQDLACATHSTDVQFAGEDAASVTLTPGEDSAADRDFILKYRLAGDAVASGLMLYEGEKENFFLAMVQPPARVLPEQIPPREMVFVVDVSGSMNGFPLDTAKTMMRRLVTGLRPEDRFNLLLFAGGSSVLAPRSIEATRSNVERAIGFLEKERGGGGTELLPALQHAFGLPGTEGMSRTLVLLTDGYVRVEAEAFDLVRTHLGRGNFHAMGIGSSVNRHLVEGLAHCGSGEAFVVTRPEEAEGVSRRFWDFISAPVLTGIEVSTHGLETYEVEPASVPDVLAQRPVLIYGKWRGPAKGRIEIRGEGGAGAYAQVLQVAESPPSATHAALRYLWARERIRTLSDYILLGETDERRREVTNLGLTYSLLTGYTSFVAVDEVVRTDPGRAPEQVKQPLPLPQGVSKHAVGGTAPISPEPETWMLMAVVAASALYLWRRKRTTRT